MDAAEAIHEKFLAKVGQGNLPRRTSGVRPDEVGLARETMVDLFYSQVRQPADGPPVAPAAGARRGLLHDRQLGP